MILYQDCSSHLDSSKNIASRGQGLFSLYIYIENIKNLLVRNHWTDFNIILQKCSFGDPLRRFSSHLDSSKNMASTKIVQAIWIRQKNMAASGVGGGAYFPYVSI